MELLSVKNLFKYKIIKNNYYTYQDSTIDQIPTYDLRRTIRHIPLTFNNYGDRLDEIILPMTFNILPDEIKALNRIGQIKKNVKKYLINSY